MDCNIKAYMPATALTLYNCGFSATQTAGQQGYLRIHDNKLVDDVILRMAISWRSIMPTVAELRSVHSKNLQNLLINS